MATVDDILGPAPQQPSKGVLPNGMLPGHAGTLDRSKAGDNWATFELSEEGIPKHYVLPTQPGDKMADDATGFMGDAVERFKKTGQHFGAFDTDEAGAAFMKAPSVDDILGPAKPTTPLLMPGMAANPVPHTGYGAQVAAAMNGPGPQQVQAKSFGELGQNYGDLAKGAAIGVPAGIMGAPGDVEALARMGASKLGIMSPDNVMPTSSDMGNHISSGLLGGTGEPSSPYEAAGRIGGNLASPIPGKLLLQGIGKGVGIAAKNALGLTTGAGSQAISGAYQAGKQGGNASQTFLDAMRGNTPVTEVVQTAKDAVKQLKQERSAAYKAGIGTTITGDKAILDFKPITDAIAKTMDVGSFKGEQIIPGASKVREKISDLISRWQGLDPAEYHTPEGLDALKQAVWNLAHDGELSAVAAPGKPGAAILGAVGNAIKDQIVAQAPGYAKVMRDYSNASDELRNIEGSLSLGNKALTDTSLRKLQSIMRNNANTNYGARVSMGEKLDATSGGDLMPALAGQSLSDLAPRGLARVLAGSEVAGAMTHPAAAMAIAPALAASSPRLVGEAAHGLGALAGRFKQSPVSAGGGANISGPAINPRLIAQMSPQVLARLLLSQNAQASQ